MLYPGAEKPLFKQFMDAILLMIEDGKYRQGDPLPSERELATQFGISRVTVRQALNSLAQDGIIFKKQGKGNFVATRRIETKLDSLLGFAEEFATKNIDCEISVVKQGYELGSAEVITALRAEDSPALFLLVRNINVDGHPLGVDYTYIPKNIAYNLGQIDFNKVIVYQLLEQLGYKLNSAEQKITAEMPTPQECALLEVGPRTPILVRSRVAYMEGGSPVVYSKAIYRGDRYHYSLALSRYPKDDFFVRLTK